MQHHGNAAPARRQDRWRSDVAPRREHRINGFALDHPAHADAGPEQAD